MEDAVARPKAPWHLWVIGIVSLLWNGYGGYDYYQTQIGNRDYLAAMTEPFGFNVDAAIAYYDAFPAWMDAAWAVGVWGAVLASVLLLSRSRYAFHAFAAAFVGLAVAMAYQFAHPFPGLTDSPIALAFSAGIVVIMLLLIWYAKRMTAAGVLR